jgi:hypothetical protein
MTKNRNSEAYKIFKRIATSNKKNLDELNELNALNRFEGSSKSPRLVLDDNSVAPMRAESPDVQEKPVFKYTLLFSSNFES